MSKNSMWLFLVRPKKNGRIFPITNYIEGLEVKKSDLKLLDMAISKARLIKLDGDMNERLHQLYCRFSHWRKNPDL